MDNLSDITCAGGMTYTNRLKPHAISGTRSQGTKCTLEIKSLVHRSTSDHLRFIDNSLLSGNLDVTISFPKKGRAPTERTPTPVASMRLRFGSPTLTFYQMVEQSINAPKMGVLIKAVSETVFIKICGIPKCY